MIQNQFARRNLSNYVRGGLGLRLEEFFRQKAEENLKLAAEQTNAKLGNSTPLLNSTNPLNSAIKSVNTRNELAKVSGVGSDTIFQRVGNFYPPCLDCCL